MSTTRLPSRWRSILLGICTVLGLGLCSGCSGKDRTSDQQDDAGGRDTGFSEDASDDELDTSGFPDDTPDTKVEDTGDIGTPDSENGGDQTLRRVSSLPFNTDDFYQLTDRWAVYVPVSKVLNKQEYLTYIVLYDTRNPKDIEVVDHRRYRGNEFAAAARGKKLFVAGDPSDTEGSWVKRFGVDGGELVEEASFSGGLGSSDPLDSRLHDVVTNAQRVIVVLNEDFLEIGDTGTLGFGVSHRFDRTAELMKRGAGDEYAMTEDGDIIEVRRSGSEASLTVWRTGEGSSDAGLIVGKLEAKPRSGTWTYSDQTEMMYAITDNESGGSDSYDFITGFDLSDPTNPTVAKRWSLETDLSESIRRPDALFAHGSKLYLTASLDLFVFSVSSKPADMTELARVDSSDLALPAEGARAGLGSAIVTEESVFVGYSADSSPAFPKVRFVKYGRSEIEGK